MQPINLHHRKSIRLKAYDYASPVEYFITICTYKRDCLFGEIKIGEMHLNPLGLIVQEEWLRTAEIREDVKLDSFVVMPNHTHGIITLIESGRGTSQRYLVGANCHSPQEKHTNNSSTNGAYIDTPLRETKFYSPSGTIGAIVRGFKSVSTKRINLLRNTPRQSVWQRNYYEHIVRDEKDLYNVREYIITNPMQWHMDEENPNKDDQIAMTSDGIY